MNSNLNRSIEEYIEKDFEHYVHGFGVVGQRRKLIWEKAKGARLYDASGKEYIDMTSGGAQCAHLGFGRSEIIEAVYEQMKKMSFIICHLDMSHTAVIEYAAELAEVLPGGIDHVFFTNSGTEANETALAMARLYWQFKGEKDKRKIICLDHGYHGGSIFTRSVSGIPGISLSPLGYDCSGIVRIPNYHCHRCPYNLSYPSCNILCARIIEQIIKQETAEQISCIIAEPIQGFAGVVWPPDEFWPIVREITRKYGVLLIADCVQTGFCRTGKFWAMSHWDVIPDMMTIGKGINGMYVPLAAVGIGREVYEGLEGHFFMTGSTANGHPVAVAAARAALKIYMDEKLDDRSNRLGRHMRERLIDEFLPLPCVDDIMGKGLYQSFEVNLGKTTGITYDQEEYGRVSAMILDLLLGNRVITRVEHSGRIYLTPPLLIGDDELDAALDVIRDVMKEVKPPSCH